MICYGFIVVNVQTEYWDEAVDFLRHMYGKEFQSQNPEYLLRKDVLRENMVSGATGSNTEIFTLTGMEIPLKKDGGSYVEDYIMFMDSCRAETQSAETIGNIIREETGAYLQNIQDVDNTARVIQSRVQLFLNENR